MDNYKVGCSLLSWPVLTPSLSPQLLNRLGRGAQGSVYLVEDKLTNNKCVLKKVNQTMFVMAASVFAIGLYLSECELV